MRALSKWMMAGLFALWGAAAVAAEPAACRKITLQGQVSAAQSWRAPIGEGWVLRLLPIVGNYSGWDLVMDREQAAGYPDALLLATPPYGSINEREIGTSYGLRAQDAIGWNPRSFHFLTDPVAFREAQQLFPRANGNTAEATRAQAQLMALAAHAASGELRIEDARIHPGIADPQHFAQSWAERAARMPHTEVPAPGGRPTAHGGLEWMRFTVTLWVPGKWKPVAGVSALPAPCP